MTDEQLADLRRFVKPLEWVDCSDGSSHDDGRMYEVIHESKWYKLCLAVTGGGSYLAHYPTLEAAKAAAQADYADRILSAVPALLDEVVRLRGDCGILLAQIDYLQEVTGNGPEGEDAALVTQIRKGLTSPRTALGGAHD